MKGLNTLVTPIKISEDAELVVSRLERLLFTQRGTVLGEPEFGSFIPELLYEPAELGLAKEILRELEAVIIENESEIVLEGLDVALDTLNDEGFEEGVLEIGIQFRMLNAENPEEKINVEFFKIAQLR